MGEAKRRKATREAAALPPPDVFAHPDILMTTQGASAISSADKAHLLNTRLNCRKQSRKALKAAKAAMDSDTRRRALTTISAGTGFIFDQQLEDFYRSSQKSQQIKHRVACGMGCYFCCHLTVTTTPVEAISLALTIQATDPSLIDKVIETAPIVAPLSSKERLDKQIPCPLLRKGLCSVHEVRPLKCRQLFSFDAKVCKVAFCGTEEERDTARVPVFNLPSLIEPALSDGVRLACADEGLQSCMVELIGALNLIFSDSTAVDRWFNGEAVFQPFTG